MGASDYVRRLREHVGHDLILLPGATAVIFDDSGRVLLGSQLPSLRWSFIGGAVEPEESPREAVLREIKEEIGASAEVAAAVGSYGGTDHTVTYENGDIVSYVTNAFVVRLTSPIGELEADEIAETAWFTLEQVAELDRPVWLDRVLRDAVRVASNQASPT
jgi:8-oxo-dGTP pyrophosphatase MutT (NUDIX family)